MEKDQLGFISMRNEDGTQWYTIVDGGMNVWGDYRERRAFTRETFEELERGADETRKNDCPDNGFFGLYNLRFTECTVEEAHEQQIIADAIQREDDDLGPDPLGDWHGRNE